MSTPAVSVVLPTYNRAPVLGRAIRSVLAQTFSDLELLVVDDGSTDETAEVVAGFNDRRLRYLPGEHHGSASITRNIGIRASRAPLIAFQDSDDDWLIDKLARQLEAMRRAPADTVLVCGGFIIRMINGRVQYLGPDERMRIGDWGPDNILDFCFMTPTWLVKRETLDAAGLFDEAMYNLEDWELAFRLYHQGRMIALPEPVVFKNGHGDGINFRPEPRIDSLERVIQRHGDTWREHPRELASLYEELGRWRCRKGDTAAGRRDLWQALRLYPASVKCWIAWGASLFGAGAYKRLQAFWGKRKKA